jgi:hypothetical protein
MSDDRSLNIRLRSFFHLTFVITLLLSTLVSVSSSAIGNFARRSPPPLPSGWVSVGCYTDGPSPRTLSAQSYSSSNVDAETCTAFCSAYAYAGMEYGNECYCGDSLLGGSTAVNSSECNMMCAGNGAEFCGGSWLLTLLQQPAVPTVAPPTTLETYNTWDSLGCYRCVRLSILPNFLYLRIPLSATASLPGPCPT